MSASAQSKRPETLSRLGRNDRVVAVIAAIIGPVVVWLVATAGFGQQLYSPGFGGTAPQELSIWLVAATAGIAVSFFEIEIFSALRSVICFTV